MSEKIKTQLIQIKVILLVGFSIVLIGVFIPDDMEPTVGVWVLGLGGTVVVLYCVLRALESLVKPSVDNVEQEMEDQLKREKEKTQPDHD